MPGVDDVLPASQARDEARESLAAAVWARSSLILRCIWEKNQLNQL